MSSPSSKHVRLTSHKVQIFSFIIVVLASLAVVAFALNETSLFSASLMSPIGMAFPPPMSMTPPLPGMPAMRTLRQASMPVNNAPRNALTPSGLPQTPAAAAATPSISYQCGNGRDDWDVEDRVADASDPGCHTDSNAANPQTYDRNDKDERHDPRCQNGLKEGVEECDDGNSANNDGCSDRCKKEAICGNGTREGNESCDDGNDSDEDYCLTSCQRPRTCRVRCERVSSGVMWLHFELCTEEPYRGQPNCDDLTGEPCSPVGKILACDYR